MDGARGGEGFSYRLVDWVCHGDGVLDVYETLWHPEDGYLGETGIPYNLTTVPKGDYAGADGHLSEVIQEADE